MARSVRDTAPVLEILKTHYPDAHCALHFSNPFELLVATILSAQCTDERVNLATPEVFRQWPDPKSMSKAKIEKMEKALSSINFYKNKSRNLIQTAQLLVEKFNSEVPQTIEELIELPGVGRKTANVVLGNAFGLITGVVVDTHVGRLSRRLGWTRSEDPIKIELDLMKKIPSQDWIMISHYLISHGRSLCKARNPSCDDCFLQSHCLKKGVTG